MIKLTEPLWLLAAVILLMNLVGLGLMGLDKRYAQRQAYRISEKTLLLTALFGGGLGIYTGMVYFHHKTKKPKFKYGVPLIIIIQCLILVALSL